MNIQDIDPYLRPYIWWLNRAGYITLFCCSGLAVDHGGVAPSGPYVSFQLTPRLENLIKQGCLDNFNVWRDKYRGKYRVAIYLRDITREAEDDPFYHSKWKQLLDILLPGLNKEVQMQNDRAIVTGCHRCQLGRITQTKSGNKRQCSHPRNGWKTVTGITDIPSDCPLRERDYILSLERERRD